MTHEVILFTCDLPFINYRIMSFLKFLKCLRSTLVRQQLIARNRGNICELYIRKLLPYPFFFSEEGFVASIPTRAGRLTIMSYLNPASVILKLPSVFGYGLLVLHSSYQASKCISEAHVTFSLNASGMNKLKWVIQENMMQIMQCSGNHMEKWKQKREH